MEKLPIKLTVGQRFFGTDFSSRGNRNRLKAHHIADYIRTVRGIEISEKFPIQLVTIHQQNHGNVLNLSTRTIDAIIDACEIFSEYVYDMNELVCCEILTMAKIHTCVLSKKHFSKQLIRMKDNPPDSLLAIVQKNGFVQVTGSH